MSGAGAVTTRVRMAVAMALLAAAAGCGGSGSSQPASQPAAQAAAPAFETKWLRGLWANDIRDAVGQVGLTCKGPAQEGQSSVWTCESGTPLVSYRLRFYGSAPGKIEYLNAVVTQSGPAKDAIPLRLFGVMAGLHFDGANPAQAKAWLATTIEAGGNTVIGPAKYKLAGDPGRRVFDVKAGGSEW
jgi:hypothetical protein